MAKVVENYVRTELKYVTASMPPCVQNGEIYGDRSLSIDTHNPKSLPVQRKPRTRFQDIGSKFDNTHVAVINALVTRVVNSTMTGWMCQILATRIAETEVES